jgi:hypothetical protein
MKLLRVGFANFRSIGPEPVILDLTKRVNLLIGANNSGKSNVLAAMRAIASHSKVRTLTHELRPSGTDLHFRKEENGLQLLFDCAPTEESELPKPINRLHIALESGHVEWKQTSFEHLDWREFSPFLQTWQRAHWSSRPSEDSLNQEKEETALRAFSEAVSLFPEVHIIPQFRKIAGGNYEISGNGVIELLAKWKSPEIGQDQDRDKFNNIQAFLRELLEMPSISLDIPRTNPELIVERDSLRLPLDNYGTGIHQLIILAIAVLAKENELIAIEEPEIHLHPLLQKAFLRFLIEKTSNNYLITTHSHAFLSQPEDCHIIHLWLEDGVTQSRHVETTAHTLEVLHDLGIKAADILQANFVIWVEGPSDRTYLNRWIELAAPELREGIDYSIMFYGGRLLSHVSMGREEDELTEKELIKLLRINQHSAIVIDSDRKKGSDALNDTKARIQTECKKNGVFCWITAGREIENYLPAKAVSQAYEKITGTRRDISVKPFQKFETVVKKSYGNAWRASFAYEDRKPPFARKIAAEIAAIEPAQDLEKQIAELVRRIRVHAPRPKAD